LRRALRSLRRALWTGCNIAGPRASTNNCGIVGNRWGDILLCRRALFDPQVLDICATEDDIFVDLIGGRKLVVWVAPATLRAERLYIFERNCRIV